jgi:hypothetical protein
MCAATPRQFELPNPLTVRGGPAAVAEAKDSTHQRALIPTS